MTAPPLPPMEAIKATIVAMLAPLLLFGLLFGLALGGPVAFVGVFVLVLLIGLPIAAAHVVALWLPSYLLLRHVGLMGWWQAGLLGLACGGLPTLLLSWPVPATAGGAAFFGACGLVGGLASHCSVEWKRI